MYFFRTYNNEHNLLYTSQNNLYETHSYYHILLNEKYKFEHCMYKQNLLKFWSCMCMYIYQNCRTHLLHNYNYMYNLLGDYNNLLYNLRSMATNNQNSALNIHTNKYIYGNGLIHNHIYLLYLLYFCVVHNYNQLLHKLHSFLYMSTHNQCFLKYTRYYMYNRCRNYNYHYYNYISNWRHIHNYHYYNYIFDWCHIHNDYCCNCILYQYHTSNDHCCMNNIYQNRIHNDHCYNYRFYQCHTRNFLYYNGILYWCHNYSFHCCMSNTYQYHKSNHLYDKSNYLCYNSTLYYFHMSIHNYQTNMNKLYYKHIDYCKNTKYRLICINLLEQLAKGLHMSL